MAETAFYRRKVASSSLAGSTILFAVIVQMVEQLFRKQYIRIRFPVMAPMKTPHANRRKAQRAKFNKGWCHGCDRYYLTAHKCPVCGYSYETKRAKKVAPSIEEFLD